MKNILSLVTMAFSTIAFAQNNTPINLKWKIGSNEKLNYLTAMTDIDSAYMNIDFDLFPKLFSDSSKKGINETRNFFKELNKTFENVDFITTLSNKGNNVIDIVMSTRQKKDKTNADSKQDGLLKLMQATNNGVMLRGSVYATGGIHSFWVKSDQKNLVAIFFELPSKPVKIGDTWPLDINLIANDQNFVCDSSYKMNEVKLADVKLTDADTVAVLKYNIIEYVTGVFNTPAFIGGGGKQPTMLKFTHQAIAEFSINKGRWISYNGIMSLEASGPMNADKKTKFSLISE